MRGMSLRVVLPVAVDPDHVLESQFICQFVAGLHAAAQPEMMRQRQDGGPGPPRALDRRIERAIVDHEHRHAGDMLVNRADHALDRPFLVPGRHDHQQGFRTLGANQSAANLLAVMEWLRTRRRKIRRVIRARARMSRRCRRNRAAWREKREMRADHVPGHARPRVPLRAKTGCAAAAFEQVARVPQIAGS